MTISLLLVVLLSTCSTSSTKVKAGCSAFWWLAASRPAYHPPQGCALVGPCPGMQGHSPSAFSRAGECTCPAHRAVYFVNHYHHLKRKLSNSISFPLQIFLALNRRLYKVYSLTCHLLTPQPCHFKSCYCKVIYENPGGFYSTLHTQTLNSCCCQFPFHLYWSNYFTQIYPCMRILNFHCGILIWEPLSGLF